MHSFIQILWGVGDHKIMEIMMVRVDLLQTCRHFSERIVPISM